MECQHWVGHLFTSCVFQLLARFLESSDQHRINDILHLDDSILICGVYESVKLRF